MMIWRYGVVVNLPNCHVGDPGSIPGTSFTFWTHFSARGEPHVRLMQFAYLLISRSSTNKIRSC